MSSHIDINIAAILGLDVDADALDCIVEWRNHHVRINEITSEKTEEPATMSEREFVAEFAPTGYSSERGHYDYSDQIVIRSGHTTRAYVARILGVSERYGFEREFVALERDRRDRSVDTYLLSDGVYEIQDRYGRHTVLIVAGQILATIYEDVDIIAIAKKFV